jgi:hypothetical protein
MLFSRPQTAGAEALFALLARLDRHGEFDLFLLGQQRFTRCCLEVQAEDRRRRRS